MDYLSTRNRKYFIRRLLVASAIALAIAAFIVWGWSLPEV